MNNLSIRKMNEVSKRKKKGFTLIELIIVIAIIAILAAIAIPKFGAVRQNANVAADQANAKIIATAVATAVSNGDITVPTTGNATFTSADYSEYIDGGTVPKVKSVESGTWDVNYSDADGVTVKVNDEYMYPADREPDKDDD